MYSLVRYRGAGGRCSYDCRETLSILLHARHSSMPYSMNATYADTLGHSPSVKVFMLIGTSTADPPIARCVSLLNSLRS